MMIVYLLYHRKYQIQNKVIVQIQQNNFLRNKNKELTLQIEIVKNLITLHIKFKKCNNKLGNKDKYLTNK